MIVGRGGGSTEDMWCFNDERVARALAATRVPVISAVGHEIDFTIADFVADLRAPTPSAAAELVSKNALEVAERIALLRQRLNKSGSHQRQLLRQKIDGLARRLVDPKRRLQDLAQRSDELAQRLEAALRRRLTQLRQEVQLCRARLSSPEEVLLRWQQQVHILRTKLEAHAIRAVETLRAQWGQASALLDAVSPLKVVERGYSITRKNNQLIRSAEDLRAGDLVSLTFAKGRAEAKIERTENGV